MGLKKIEITKLIDEKLKKDKIYLKDLLNKTKTIESYDIFIQEFTLIKNTFKDKIPEFVDICDKYLNNMDEFINECKNIKL